MSSELTHPDYGSESDDEDFTYKGDSADELIDDITYQQSIDPDVEWAGTLPLTTNNEEGKESESDTDDDCLASESDFDSVGTDDDDEKGDDIVHKASTSTSRNPPFSVGQLFSTKDVFKAIVDDYAVKIGRGADYPKNEGNRIYAKCAQRKKGCSWHINIRKVDEEESFHISQMDLTHSCPRQSKVKNANSTFVAKKFLTDFRCDPKKSTKGFRYTAIAKLGVQLSRYQATRAKNKALKIIEGDTTDQYSKLWDYAETLREKNPGSTVILQLDDTLTGKTFKRMYVCLDAVKRGFKTGCRPLIGVDGCHLRGASSGVLLTAVCMDPNNDPYPLAYAVVSSENKDSWEWFLQHLKDDLLTEMSEYAYTFMSDKSKGLIAAFENVLPNVENRFCIRHLHGNMKRAGFKGVHFKKLLWKAGNATTIPAFNIVMAEIEKVDKRCLEWLHTKKSASEWSKSHFSTFGKCDTLLNNMCEQFNKCLLDAREKPILTMLEWIREYMMSRLQKNRDKVERKWEGRLVCGRIRTIVETNQKAAANCIPIKSSSKIYEVSSFDGSRYVVNLEAKTCDCRRWDLSGIPCNHAISAISAEDQEPEEYVHKCYSVDTYQAVYAHAINPMNGEELWQKTGYIPPLPPAFGDKKRGRPQKERRFGPNENPKKKKTSRGFQKLPRQHYKVTCGNCGESGHNRVGCKMRKECEEGQQSDKQPQKKTKTDDQDLVVCSFCIDLGHTEDECIVRMMLEQEALEERMLEQESTNDVQPDVITQIDLASQPNVITQPDFASQSNEDTSQRTSSSKIPTTRQGRKLLANQRAKNGQKETMASTGKKKIGVGALVTPSEGDSLKVFTQCGKKFVHLASLQEAATKKKKIEKEAAAIGKANE